MFVLSKSNLIIPAPDGSTSVRLYRGQLAEIPAWVMESDYFRALVSDGDIIPTGKQDRETQAAAERKTRVRRGGEITEA